MGAFGAPDPSSNLGRATTHSVRNQLLYVDRRVDRDKESRVGILGIGISTIEKVD